MKRVALVTLFLCMVVIGLTYAATIARGGAPAWGAWSIALASTVAMVAVMVLGAVRRGKARGGLGKLALPLVFVLVLVGGSFALALLLPSAQEPLLLGIPRRAAIIVYGIGLLPVFILPVAYALTFKEMTLDESDLHRVRRAAEEHRRTESAPKG